VVGEPVQLDASEPVPPLATDEANTESFFESFDEPQCGHFVPSQSLERTRISLSFSQAAQ